MSTVDPQLVDAITHAVLDALGDSTIENTKQAHIRPPAGICTGDYSKFIELQKTPPTPRELVPWVEPERPKPLTGFITARQLEDAAAASQTIPIDAKARLTPLAQDWVKEHPGIVVRSNSRNPANTPADAARPRHPRWLLWSEIDTPRLDHPALRPLPAAPRDPLAAARALAAAVRSGDAVGGVMLVASANPAICYVNRLASLRGIVGTSDASVEAGLATLAPNALIIEHTQVDLADARRMIDRFIDREPTPSRNTLSELESLASSQPPAASTQRP